MVPPAGGQVAPVQPLVQPVAVFGKDDRTKLPAELSNLKKSIGLIYNNSARSVCSGFCVADNIVATAAHCLFRTAGERRPSLRSFRFILKSRPKQLASPIEGFRSRSPAQFVVAGSRRLRVEPPIDATRDWALMRLANPICKGASLPVASHAPRDIEADARRGRLIQVAYHYDFADWQLAYSGPCKSRRRRTPSRRHIKRDFTAPQTLLLHTCDTGGASSGSPLFRISRDGSPQVVAVNVGTYIQTRMQLKNGKVVRRFKSDAIANTAVTTTVLRQLIRPFGAADIVGSKPEIVAIQQGLRARGLYKARIDGAFGPATRAAIRAFQRNTGIGLSGLPTRALLDQLAVRVAPNPELEKRSQSLTRGRLRKRIKSRRRR